MLPVGNPTIQTLNANRSRFQSATFRYNYHRIKIFRICQRLMTHLPIGILTHGVCYYATMKISAAALAKNEARLSYKHPRRGYKS